MDQAYHNRIFHSTIGLGAGSSGAIPNAYGGIRLDIGSSDTTIGGKAAPLHNVIQSNTEAGLYIYYSKKNTVLNNSIEDNSLVGVLRLRCLHRDFDQQQCDSEHGTNGSNNVDIANATGLPSSPDEELPRKQRNQSTQGNPATPYWGGLVLDYLNYLVADGLILIKRVSRRRK